MPLTRTAHFGKACRQMLKGSDQLLLKSMTGQLFSQGKASSIQLPQCSGNSVLTTSKSGALTVPIQLLTDSISIHIPQSTVKLGHGKLGFGIHARLQTSAFNMSALSCIRPTVVHRYKAAPRTLPGMWMFRVAPLVSWPRLAALSIMCLETGSVPQV